MDAVEGHTDNTEDKKDGLLATYGAITYTDSGKPHVNHQALAKLIVNEHNFHFTTIEDNTTDHKKIYYYEDGYYHDGGSDKIRQMVDYYLDELSAEHYRTEVIARIKTFNIINRREFVESDPRFINMKNGIFNIETNELLPHTPSFLFLNQLPTRYNPKATCPCFKKFVEEILQPEYISVVQEMFGYCLYRDYFLHVIFLLYGSGRNSKTTLTAVLKAMLGDTGYSSRQLGELIEDRFAKAELYGSFANIGADIDAKYLKHTGDLKLLSGDDTVIGQKKYHGAFSFTNYAKLIFNANRVPPSKDRSIGFFSRWIIIPFLRVFLRGDPKTNPNKKKELTTPDELEGVFLWSLEGLRRILDRGDFSYNNDGEIEDNYEKFENPAHLFIDERLQFMEGFKLRKDEVVEEYRSWSKARGLPEVTVTSFTRILRSDSVFGKMVKVGNVMEAGKTFKCYIGICWKDDSIVPHSFDGGGLMPLDEKE